MQDFKKLAIDVPATRRLLDDRVLAVSDPSPLGVVLAVQHALVFSWNGSGFDRARPLLRTTKSIVVCRCLLAIMSDPRHKGKTND